MDYGHSTDSYEVPQSHTKPPKLSANLPKEQASETESELAHPSQPARPVVKPDGSMTSRRPITDDLDTLDQKIVEFKALNFGDTQIAKILEEEEGSEYSPKTIGTRYRRIRLAKMAANDDPIEFKKKFWTMEEDAALIKAHNINKKRHERELAKVHARLFEDTAFTLNDLSADTFHSAKACEKRLEELLGGRAEPHPEDDDDPERPNRDRLQGISAKWARQCEEQWKSAIAGEDEMHNIYLGKRINKYRKKSKVDGDE